MLLGKTKLDTIEVSISNSLIELFISLDKSVSVNYVLREYSEMKQEIKKSGEQATYILLL